MGLYPDFLSVDSHDPRALAEFWQEALTTYEILDDPDDGSDPDDEIALLPHDRKGPKILFVKAPDEKVVKNRWHLDLRPDDQEAEVARLTSLGARKVDIGQGEPTWVVMADPEGNEFCILRALSEEEKEKYAAWAW